MALSLFTLAPGLFAVALVLAVAFETLVNVARARSDYVEFIDTYS